METDFKLERDEEDKVETEAQVEAVTKAKPGRKPKEVLIVEATPNPDMVASLIEQVAKLQAQLDLMAVKPIEDIKQGAIKIDEMRPFSKTRTNTGGITYEQDGYLFDACMRRKE
jgi:hypothetical protein